jgi:xanthine dehydrogenase molybdenum-binding subunit
VAAAAALALGRPVRLVFSREQVFASTVSRAPMRLAVETAFTRDGLLKSVTVDNTLDAGAYLGNSVDYCHAMSKKFFRCYRYPHLKYSARAVITNSPVSGAFRGWSSPESAIALEHNLNQAARQLNIDPLELRLRNAARAGDMDISLDISLGNFRLADCLERGRDRFAWAERKKRVARHNQPGRRHLRGLGVACGGHLNGYFPKLNDFAEAGLRMTEDGAALLNVTLHDHGCGTVTAFKMIVAEALGVSDDMVRAGEGDTAATPFDYGCFSSRTTYVIGRAAYNAAVLLKERLEAAAARLTGRPREGLRAEGGQVRDAGDPAFAMTYAEVSQGSLSRLQEELSVTAQYINKSNPGVAGAHLAEVEVDTATGLVRIVDYLAVHDIGQAINRAICVGQIQGAVLMGGGAALCEKVGLDRQGRATRSLKDYHLINAFEAPNIEVELIEEGETDGPFGAKSIGEVCHSPVAPAIMGAVNDALGTAACVLPLNPDAVVKLLKEKGYRYAAEL